MKRIIRILLVLSLSLSLSGCLGTIVTAPTAGGKTYDATSPHLILSSMSIPARDCSKGMKEVAVYVPLWGVAVGILTFGILVPMNTQYTCAI